MYLNSAVFSCKFHGCHGLISEDFGLMNLHNHCFLNLSQETHFLIISREMRALNAKKSRDYFTNGLYIYHLCVNINFHGSPVVFQYVNE